MVKNSYPGRFVLLIWFWYFKSLAFLVIFHFGNMVTQHKEISRINGTYIKYVGRGGQRVLQFFLKKIHSPGENRP